MADYLVIWEIDIDADSPEEAAEIARTVQMEAGSDATYFTVRDKNTGLTTAVDLDNNFDEG